MDGPGGIRTPDQGIMLTTTSFLARISLKVFRIPVWGLDYIFSLRASRIVSTPSRHYAALGSVLPYPFGKTDVGFTELEKFYHMALSGHS
jgi:hypothetical protein